MSTFKCATGVYAINAKDNQDDTNAINAINEGIQLVQLYARGCKVNQIESIKMGMSSKIVLKFQKNFSGQKIKLKAREMCRANSQQMTGKRKPPASHLQGALSATNVSR